MSYKEKISLVINIIFLLIFGALLVLGFNNLTPSGRWAYVVAYLFMVIYMVFSMIYDHFIFYPKPNDEANDQKVYPKETRLKWYQYNRIFLIAMFLIFNVVQFIIIRMYPDTYNEFSLVIVVALITFFQLARNKKLMKQAVQTQE